MRDLLDQAMRQKVESNDYAVVELRGCVGGDEANLFTLDLFNMYQRFCESKGWKCTVTDESRDDTKGMKEGTIIVEGSDCYKLLKFEAGIHRVQRVPATETQGRVHTSTASVAVLPKPEKVIITFMIQSK
jgi:peptide chain release factor 1